MIKKFTLLIYKRRTYIYIIELTYDKNLQVILDVTKPARLKMVNNAHSFSILRIL